jgi:transposase
LAEDHLAWFVIDAVERMDLAAFYAAYRADGHGRAAYEPAMMVSLVLYASRLMCCRRGRLSVIAARMWRFGC